MICRLCSHTKTICPTYSSTWNDTTKMNMPSFKRQILLQKSHSSPRSLTVLLPLHLWERVPFNTSSYTVFVLSLETVPAWYQHLLGTISSDSVNMTKACQHRAEPCRAGPANFDKVSWHGTSSAQHLLTCQCNDIEPNPCCTCAMPSTELVCISPKNM